MEDIEQRNTNVRTVEWSSRQKESLYIVLVAIPYLILKNRRRKEGKIMTETQISEYEASHVDKLRGKKEAKRSRVVRTKKPTNVELLKVGWTISENQPVQTKEELRIHFPELDSRDIELLLDLSANGSEGDTYCRKNHGIKSVFRVNNERRIEKISSGFDMTEGEINREVMREFVHPSVCYQCKGSLASGYIEWSSNRYCRNCGLKKFLTFIEKMDKELPPAEKERLDHEGRNARIKKIERNRKRKEERNDLSNE